jgi:hypothetical protein
MTRNTDSANCGIIIFNEGDIPHQKNMTQAQKGKKKLSDAILFACWQGSRNARRTTHPQLPKCDPSMCTEYARCMTLHKGVQP